MIEKILSIGTKDYYKGVKEGNEIIVSVWNCFERKNIDEVTEGFKVADMKDYLSQCKEVLGNIFNLDIFSFGSFLNPLNYNLFEYDYFIKGNKKPLKSLLNACICANKEEGYYYIAVEPYNSEITKQDIQEIEKYIYFNSKDIEKKLNMNYSHTEIY